MYRNNILNFQGSTPILNSHTKNSGNLLNAPRNNIKKTTKKKLLSTASLTQTHTCIYIYDKVTAIEQDVGNAGVPRSL